jgi:hypothetical protein
MTDFCGGLQIKALVTNPPLYSQSYKHGSYVDTLVTVPLCNIGSKNVVLVGLLKYTIIVDVNLLYTVKTAGSHIKPLFIFLSHESNY